MVDHDRLFSPLLGMDHDLDLALRKLLGDTNFELSTLPDLDFRFGDGVNLDFDLFERFLDLDLFGVYERDRERLREYDLDLVYDLRRERDLDLDRL